MKKFFKLICVSLALLLCFTVTTSYAKRAPAPEVPFVFNHGVKYFADYSNGGVIKAYSAKTKQLLWTVKIFNISYDPQLERDIQDVYITEMKVKRGYLLIKDEKHREYSLNLKTHQVKRL